VLKFHVVAQKMEINVRGYFFMPHPVDLIHLRCCRKLNVIVTLWEFEI